MTLLPAAIAIPVTWMLCFLLIWAFFRQWYLEQVNRTKSDIVWWHTSEAGPPKLSFSERLFQLVIANHERNYRLSEGDLTIYAAGRAVKRAIIAAPLAIITTKAMTNDTVFGIFAVFRDQPGMAERLGRCLLIVLFFVAVVTFWHRIEKWSNDFVSNAGSGVRARIQRKIGSPVLFLMVMALYALGLTPALILILTIILFVTVFFSDQVRQSNLGPEEAPIRLGGVYMLVMAGLLVTLLVLNLVGLPLAGFVAAVLLLGVILPVACAPAGFVVIAGTDRLIERIVDSGKLNVMMAPVTIALLGVGALAIGLGGGLSLYAALAPEAYSLNLLSAWEGMLSDPAYAWPVLVLVLITLITPLGILIEGIAREVIYHSKAWHRAVALVESGIKDDATAIAFVHARMAGYSITGLLIGLPVFVLAAAFLHA